MAGHVHVIFSAFVGIVKRDVGNGFLAVQVPGMACPFKAGLHDFKAQDIVFAAQIKGSALGTGKIPGGNENLLQEFGHVLFG